MNFTGFGMWGGVVVSAMNYTFNSFYNYTILMCFKYYFCLEDFLFIYIYNIVYG